MIQRQPTCNSSPRVSEDDEYIYIECSSEGTDSSSSTCDYRAEDNGEDGKIFYIVEEEIIEEEIIEEVIYPSLETIFEEEDE